MIRNVRLYGAMAREFAPEYRLDVGSVAEAVRALSIQIPGFRAAVEAGRFRVVCGPSPRSGIALDEPTLGFGLPAGDIHLTPVVQGRGGRGASIGKIILGVVIVAAAFTFSIPVIGSIGASLVLGGLAGLLAAKKKKETQKQSYMINDGANGSQQGVPLAWVSGRTMVTPINISSGVTCAFGNGLASPPANPVDTTGTTSGG